MKLLAHTDGMMNGMDGSVPGIMVGGMFIFGLLLLMLLLVLVVLGIMAIVILYKHYFATKKHENKM